VRAESRKDFADCVADGLDVSGGGLSPARFPFSEDLLDRVEIGRVFWEEDAARADRSLGSRR
jgi:hypothetical protein